MRRCSSLPPASRWYPVFNRYLKKIAGRVQVFGGDPTKILPSPTGDGPWNQHPGKPHHHKEPWEDADLLSFTGKIAGLLFDRFGDFEGFILDTIEEERKFYSREEAIKILAERAWAKRLRITVRTEPHEIDRSIRIILHKPPLPM